MLKYFFSLQACFFIILSVNGQNMQSKRYKDIVFPGVTVGKNFSYNENTIADIKKNTHNFDLYQPANDSAANRPLIIWMHGGGFKFGSKDAREIEIWGNVFAQRGYVFAAINYQLSKENTLTNFDKLVQGCYTAVQDAKTAVSYFKKKYEKYGIDTNMIILAGNSAGGIIALQAVYSNNIELEKLANKSNSNLPPQNYNPQNIAAVINFWGAIFDINWLKNTNVPIVSVHGKYDRIVPIDHIKTPMYGSLSIHVKADSLGIPNRLKIYSGFAHELQRHFNPFFSGSGTRKRWIEAGEFAANFLYDTLYK
jgi:predicted esterase